MAVGKAIKAALDHGTVIFSVVSNDDRRLLGHASHGLIINPATFDHFVRNAVHRDRRGRNGATRVFKFVEHLDDPKDPGGRGLKLKAQDTQFNDLVVCPIQTGCFYVQNQTTGRGGAGGGIEVIARGQFACDPVARITFDQWGDLVNQSAGFGRAECTRLPAMKGIGVKHHEIRLAWREINRLRAQADFGNPCGQRPSRQPRFLA